MNPTSTCRRLESVRRNRLAPTTQHERDRDLHDQERLAQPGARTDDAAARFLERGADVDTGAAQCGRDAEEQARQAAHAHDEGEDLPVERHRLARRSRQKLFSPIADEDPERAAHPREQQALGQELAHQPPARRAERQPHRQFLLPRGRAREQQVGHVRTDDQQDERDDDAEDGHRAQLVRVDVVHAARAGLDEQPRHFRPVADCSAPRARCRSRDLRYESSPLRAVCWNTASRLP